MGQESERRTPSGDVVSAARVTTVIRAFFTAAPAYHVFDGKCPGWHGPNDIHCISPLRIYFLLADLNTQR